MQLRLNLASKLALVLTAFAALLLLALSALFYSYSRSSILEARLSDLLSIASEKEAALDYWAAERKREIVNLASINLVGHLEDYKTELSAAGDVEGARSEVRQLLVPWTGENGAFRSFMYLEPRNAEVVYSTAPGDLATFKENRSYFRNGLEGVFLGKPYYSVTLQAPTMVASVPLRDVEGSLLGVLAGRLNLTELNDILARRTGLYETDDAYLVNTANVFVSQPRRIRDSAVLQRGIRTAAVDRCLAGKSFTELGADFLGVPVIAAYRWLPGRELCLVVTVAQAEALSGIRELGWAVLLISAVVFAVAGTVAILLARMVTRPVLALQQGAMAIGAGDLAVRLPERSSDEIGQLAQAFNAMARSLEQGTDALRISEAQFKSLFETAPVMLHVIDHERRIQAVNQTWLKTLGYDLDEVVGQEITTFMAPESAHAAITVNLPKLMEKGLLTDVSYQFVRRSGELADVLLSSYAERNRHDGGQQVVAAMIDITERKRAEEEQRKTLAQLRHAQRIAELDCWLWDSRKDEVQFFGHGDKVHGVPIDRLQGLSEQEYDETYVHPEDREWVLAAYAQLPETKQVGEFEYRVFDADGEVRFIHELVEPIFDEVGALIGNFGTLQDITDRKLAERELAETTGLLNGIFEAAYLIISVKDAEGRYVLVNPEYERVFRRSIDELRGKTIYEVWPKEYADLQVEQERRAIELRKPVQQEKQAPLADGTLGTYLTVKTPVFDPDGNLIAMGTISTDITERKAAEERFRRYFELPLVGSAIYTPEKEWIQVNDKLCDLLGYSREELMALTWAELTHPDDLADNVRLFTEAIAGQRDTYTMDKRFIRKDGEIVYTAISVQCLRRPDGAVDYFILLIQDITKRRLAEESLRLTQLCVDHASEAIFWVSENAQITYVNEAACDLLGYSRDELLSLRVFDVDPLFRDEVWPEFWKAFETKGTLRFETLHRRKDGDEFPVEVVVNLFRNQGRVFMTAYVRDISERRRAEERIQRLNEKLEQRVEQRTAELRAAQEELVRKERLAALGQLTGTVSHELRNPLGAMRTSVAAIKKLAPTDQPLLTSSVAIVDRSITRCDNIIADLLDYSRVRPLELELTQIDGWLMELLEEYQFPPGISLVRELESGAALPFDHDRLGRVLVNLLDNARQAMLGQGRDAPEGEHVLTVASRQTGQVVELSVSDTGPGIAPDELRKIFEPMYSTKAFGVGLGLSIVKRIVEQHEGIVSAESEPGQGTRFIVRLPLKVPVERAAS